MMKRCGEEIELTEESMLWENITEYMNDEIREQLHNALDLTTCTPEEFLREYIKIEPEFEELLWSEFGIEL